jgi:hypothetical protein
VLWEILVPFLLPDTILSAKKFSKRTKQFLSLKASKVEPAFSTDT